VHLYRLRRRGTNSRLAAHRGDNSRFPQNSIPAFKSAVERGAGMVELDVRRCKTGELIVIGEPGLETTTDGTGTVFEASFDYLRTLSACAPQQFGDRFKGRYKIPTLEEALDAIPADGPYINCHCTCNTAAETALVIKRKNRLARAFVASERAGARAARKAVPEIMICNMERPAASAKTWTHEEHMAYARNTVENKYEFLQYIGKNNVPPADVVKYLHDRGVKIAYVICNDPARRERIFAESGLDFIFTDKLP
jgi:glycerophosphoryl diester phosphodiesterase